jgi:phosphatidylglycerophosphatase A
MSQPSASIPSTTTNSTARKPRISLAIATAFGLGYLPKTPGTFGSIAGIALAMIPFWFRIGMGDVGLSFGQAPAADPVISLQILLTLAVALLGVLTAHNAATYWRVKDPQRVVVDEVSGQHLTLLLGGFLPTRVTPANAVWKYVGISQHVRWAGHPLGLEMWFSPNWKYLLLGFILFRVFDIWKPFPARQAESLPGGLGIMADDWIAGIYAALGLWIARALGI